MLKEKERLLKRLFDLIFSAVGIILFAPLLLAVAFLVKTASKGPAFFRQKRIGMEGKEFALYKFRTMCENSDGLKITKKGDPRITLLGKILRKTKIDEIPQLINVLKGEMSFVGPRPEVKDYVDLNNPLWQAALKVKPGITDPVTLKLRNEEELLMSEEDPDGFYKGTLQNYKLQGYAEYVNDRSFFGDLKIIVLTIFTVIIPSMSKPPAKEEIEKGWTNEN